MIKTLSPEEMRARLPRFTPLVSRWMQEKFEAPTEAQRLSWPVISQGSNTLVFSPTGSGKTLAAFLWAINELISLGQRKALPRKPYVVYISPLRALANDVERNLLAPLREMKEMSALSGGSFPDIQVAVRTGDTLPEERQRMLRHPPQILITTPESLYLLITSGFRDHLRSVRYVIVDEIHHLCGNKRGAHLAITLERLQELSSRPGPVGPARVPSPNGFVRIGLSATQSPVEEIARFLVGRTDEGEERDCTVVDLGSRRDIDLQVIAPVPNLVEAKPEEIWEAIYQQLLDLIESHRTTLIFCNSRHLTERVAAKLNMLIEERGGSLRIGAHHGSVSRAFRLEMEEGLKSGALRAVVATSSLELGIDIGHLDLVCQVESPKTVAAGLQRVGRAGHLLGLTSKGRLFATSRDDLVEMAVLAREMLKGDLERVHIPENCLDVVAQQMAAMAAVGDQRAGEMLRVLRRAHNFRDLSESDCTGILEQLSGRWGDRELFEIARPINWDPLNGRASEARGGARTVLQNSGTIPESAEYAVHAEDYDKKLGTLDEDFVQRLRPGQIFVLGTRTWEYLRVERNRVYVRDGRGRAPTIPRWTGLDYVPRSFQLGERVARFRSAMFARLFERPEGLHRWLMEQYLLSESGAQQIIEYFVEQAHSLDVWPGREVIVAETSRNPLGHPQIILHSPYGASVNEAWAEALVQAAQAEMQIELQAAYSDDALVLHLPRHTEASADDLLSLVTPDNLARWIESYVRESALFSIRFRHAAVRALAIPRMVSGRKRPIWQQDAASKRLEREVRDLARFPISVETVRECMEDHLDLDGLRHVLGELSSGGMRLASAEVDVPSPFGHELLLGGQFGALGDAARRERRAEFLSLHREILRQILDEQSIRDLLDPKVVEEFEARRQGRAPQARARDAEELLGLIRRCGELSEYPESDLFIGARAAAEWRDWLSALHREQRVVPIVLPGAADEERRWIAAEDCPLYDLAFPSKAPKAPGGDRVPQSGKLGRQAARRRIVLRALRSLGPMAVEYLSGRYGLTQSALATVLRGLLDTGEVQQGSFVNGRATPQVCLRANLEELHRRALAALRREVEPVGLDRYVDFLLKWQHLHPKTNLEGAEGIRTVLAQQVGYRAYPRIWQREVLGLRVSGADPKDLGTAVSSADLCIGQFSMGEKRPRALLAGTTFVPRVQAQEFFELPSTEQCSPQELAALRVLRDGGDRSLSEIMSATGLAEEDAELALWRLFRAGLASNTDYSAVSGCRWTSAPRLERALRGADEEDEGEESPETDSDAAQVDLRRAGLRADRGRWYAIAALADGPEDEAAFGRRCRARVMALMSRYGVAARELLLAKSDLPPADVSRGLRELFLRGQLLRGFFARNLSGDQFALPAALDRLRSESPARSEPALMISSIDPAAVHLSAVKLPGLPGRPLATRYLILHRGALLAIVDRHPGEGRFLRVRDLRLVGAAADTPPGERSALHKHVATAMLEYAVRWGEWESVRISHVDGEPIEKRIDVAQDLADAGFRLVRGELTYRLRKRVGAAAEDTMQRIVRTEEQKREDIHLTSKAVLDFHRYIVTEYVPPPDKDMLAVFQCSVSRPYSKSPSHSSMRKAIRLATGKDPKNDFDDCRCHVVVLSSIIGPVPYEMETSYPADERGGGVKHMSPMEYWEAKPVLAQRMAAYLRRWHDHYRIITTFTHGRYGDVMREARKLAGLDFTILPDPMGVRTKGGNQYWTRYWVQLFFELLKAMTEEEKAAATARLARAGAEIDERWRPR